MITSQNINYVFKPVFHILTWTCCHLLAGQTILNPSFEGTPQQGVAPQNWTACHPNSTPDTQPGIWQVSKSPSDGSTYLGLVTRGNLGPYANQNEDVQTELTQTLPIGDELKFNIDLSFSVNWGHTIDFGSTFLRYDTPAKLTIYGGASSCEKTELLWQSETINHTDWKTYLVSLSPQIIDVDFLIFQANYSTAATAFGNILLDNITPCSFEVEWVSDTTICETESLRLDASIPDGTYLWQDGSTSSQYTVFQAGTYSVSVSNGCETQDFEIVVATRNCRCDTATPIQTTSFDSAKCHQTEILLDAETPGGYYLWNTGSTHPSISVQTAGTYTVEVSNLCESKTFDFNIENLDCSCQITAPNVFTPNGDGINDQFEIKGSTTIARYHLSIYDRGGVQVFDSKELENYWNGTSGNSNLTPGVYFYVIEIMCIQDNSIVDNSFKGWVSVMR